MNRSISAMEQKNSDHESLFKPKTSAAISSYLDQTAKFRGSVHNVSSNTFFFELWAYHGVSLIVTYAMETSLESTRSLDASDSFEQLLDTSGRLGSAVVKVSTFLGANQSVAGRQHVRMSLASGLEGKHEGKHSCGRSSVFKMSSEMKDMRIHIHSLICIYLCTSMV